MKNEHVKAITEKLEVLNEKQLETIRKEVESFAETKPATPREKLFREVENAIYVCGDISINSDFGVHIGTGTNLIYNEAEEENVSLCYMFERDIMELHVNNEVALIIDKNSPILEAFQELFRQIELDRKEA